MESPAITNDWRTEQSRKALERILPELEADFAAGLEPLHLEWNHFKHRLNREWERLFRHLHELYGWQYDFYYTLQRVLRTLIEAWLERSAELRSLDHRREADPHWFLSEEMVGAVLYVDLFSERLARLPDHLPYFKRLGITYLHLMPIFSAPHGEHDGGYAVSDYRMLNPDIGTMDELSALTSALREEGISLCLDFVCNHTSDEHQWARKAREGDLDHLAYYFTYPDRELPDQFQRYLRDIFPAVRKGSFIWCEELQRWVWTTFNSFQWDLNYTNPEVLCAMAAEMFFLANRGVEVLRLDAAPFLWKRLGTNCENLPEAHVVIRAFNAMARIAAPALLFKSEAIVHPDDVMRYIHPEECQLSYNPMLMALLWEALATREVKLLEHSLRRRSYIPGGCSWANYLRCHDDIGWTFDDADARALGIDPAGHRKFLGEFYTGRHPSSFAKGVPFQFNPENGDVRVSGTLSSLAGLEQAVERGDDELIERAVRRINLLFGIITTIGGLPLLYAGDEYGMINDYTYLTDPTKAEDSRWVHRSRRRWEAQEGLADEATLEWRFFRELVRLFQLRKSLPALRNGGMEVIHTGNPHLFGYVRSVEGQTILFVHNFAEDTQVMEAARLRECGVTDGARDLFQDRVLAAGAKLVLEHHQAAWLEIGGKEPGDSPPLASRSTAERHPEP